MDDSRSGGVPEDHARTVAALRQPPGAARQPGARTGRTLRRTDAVVVGVDGKGMARTKAKSGEGGVISMDEYEVRSAVCPFCERPPELAMSIAQAFCTTEGCPVLCWDMRATPEEFRRKARVISTQGETGSA